MKNKPLQHCRPTADIVSGAVSETGAYWLKISALALPPVLFLLSNFNEIRLIGRPLQNRL